MENTLSTSKMTGVSQGSIKVGILIHKSPVSNQLILILEKLGSYQGIEALAIAEKYEYERNKAWYKKELNNFGLEVFNKISCNKLSFFNLFILPESNQDDYGYLPASVIKVGLPHGVDIPLKKTITTYGGRENA